MRRVGIWLCPLVAVSACSAISDFDYHFNDSEADAGELADSGTGDASDLDATLPPPQPDAARDAASDAADAAGDDGGACVGADCCEITEISETSCGDGKDNDCDGKGDCADTDCTQSVKCCPNPTLESGDKACTDGKDNDCDNVLDCAETSCANVYKCTCKQSGAEDGKNFPARCIDQKDNDCDQLTDCADPDCAPYPNCCTATPGQTQIETSCNDGLNNDCDPAGADCADPDCRSSSDAGTSIAVESGSACNNGKDDDCDGVIDCSDSDCRGTLACCTPTPGQESRETSCTDGINNDCDTAGADCFDSDCAKEASCCKPVSGGETTEALCGNGVDDDCDDLVDCKDPNCNSTVRCCAQYLKANGLTVQSTETNCRDAYDNDCDGKLNCADSDCPLKSCLIIIDPGPVGPGPLETSQ